MGLEYFLYRMDKGEMFELGKGNWPALFPLSGQAFRVDGLNASEIIKEKVFLYKDPSINWDEYCQWINEKIKEWAERAFIRITREPLNVPITGTRYRSANKKSRYGILLRRKYDS